MVKYRHDIDGLRAVAIFSVVLFHVNANFLPGGFTGVDIFFVISGYLITGIIHTELDGGAFSLSDFWIRRCRRILPALFFMLFLVSAAAFVFFLPDDLSEYGEMLSYSAIFMANFFLSNERSYFDPEFLHNPLLHVWSLAVEEQFYVIWPLIFLVLFSMTPRRNILFPVLILMLISLAYSQWATTHNPETAFFSLASRAFELLIGACLAVSKPGPIGRQSIADALAGLGVLSIGIGLFALDEKSHFPGLAALFPCVGAALLIVSGAGETQTFVKKILSSFLFVRVGQLSYSWYLWHWPPLAFARYYFERPLSGVEILACLVFGLSMAIISWRFIEQPFRHRPALQHRKAAVIRGCFLAIILFVTTGSFLQEADGLQWRLANEAGAMRAHFPRNTRLFHGCIEPPDAEAYSKECDFGDPNKLAPQVLLWGDSHAMHYLPAIASIAKRQNLRGAARIGIGCRPYLIFEPVAKNTRDFQKCFEHNHAVLAYLRSNPEISTVILAWRWVAEFSVSNAPRAALFLDAEIKDANQNSMIATLDYLISELSRLDRKLIILGSVPELAREPRSCLTKQIQFDLNIDDCEILDASSITAHQKFVWNALKFFEKKFSSVLFFHPQDYLCEFGRCQVLDGSGIPLYFDKDHLSTRGANYLEPSLAKLLQ